ncbi:hypothetical protein KR222_006701 [Zaprionus bogoriensis]|nr:hypothetical protein KR222_006701 [Zaprionus bogoriensis]
MKFKYQSKHKLLKSIKRISRLAAGVLVKSFFYLGCPAICPGHQLAFSCLHPPSLGFYSHCNLCPLCWAPSTLCSMSSSSLCAPCASSTTLRKWTGESES